MSDSFLHRRSIPALVFRLVLWGPVSTASASPAELIVPRVQRPPALEDFLEMRPAADLEGSLAKVDEFVQARPSDGQPASQRTEAYLGYDEKHLYVVFVAFDSEPHKIRARMVPRERFIDSVGTGIDDSVSVSLDTFADQRRGYVFQINPFGIQWDGLFTEGGGLDDSFDALWYSRGKLTGRGYIVWIALPFKSLRFSPAKEQTWGILLNRDIPRNNEAVFWPRFTTRIQGYFNQEAMLRGLREISPGRNVQFIPYGVFRSFRALDRRDPMGPRFVEKNAQGDGGLDAKFVLKDSMVLDVTANPDFSQVESDEPQVTVNERFEVFFPEKRPFFIENANYFQTSNNLLFTRRIADPRFGARLTGKIGPYAVGALLVDDESPGKRVRRGEPLEGTRALFGIARVTRDIFKQSSVGLIFTDREYEGSFNRVGGVDARFKMARNWTTHFQAVASSTRSLDGGYLAGPAYDANVTRSGRQFRYFLQFSDRSPGFRTEPGFLTRPDVRDVLQFVSYNFRPEGKALISWGPRVFMNYTWDHAGTNLNWLYFAEMQAELVGQTFIGVGAAPEFELFRPQDSPSIRERRSFERRTASVRFQSSYFRQVHVSTEFRFGGRVHLDPPKGSELSLASRTSGNFTLTLRPITPLRIDNTYLLFRLTDRDNGASIFNNHIARSKWNWQFNRELSLRVILQYDALLANPARTSLVTTRNFNADILVTYLLNPGTALHVGYNSNLKNIDIITEDGRSRIVRTPDFSNDARGLFFKLSYLFRF